ncbi:hypothetical protein F4819DRAFT_481956 [Hypoxylon fuscum]|nr:hypothetical protein F4819DRAFT_481956 [Hypoxylon fuscum]
MADRNYYKRPNLTPSSRGQLNSRPRYSRSHSHYPADAYPDAWIAQRDPNHRKRVDLSKRRRESIASNVSGSRPSTPSGTPRSKPSTDWRKETPWFKDRRSSLSSSSTFDQPTFSPSTLTDTFQEELDRYDSESRLLREGEWLNPSKSRSRARRIDAKQFNSERVKALKRWSLAEAIMYGQNSASLRDTDIKQPAQAYVPGVIFSAPFHTANSSDELYVPYDDPNLTATPFGTVNSKYRKMVVLKVFGEHCTCAPIYTHNGRGLEGKEFPKEFVSIRDVNDPHPQLDEGPHRGIRAPPLRGSSNH